MVNLWLSQRFLFSGSNELDYFKHSSTSLQFKFESKYAWLEFLKKETSKQVFFSVNFTKLNFKAFFIDYLRWLLLTFCNTPHKVGKKSRKACCINKKTYFFNPLLSQKVRSFFIAQILKTINNVSRKFEVCKTFSGQSSFYKKEE